jgi:enoyl-CoA hydratase/carnithine racemase
MPLDRVSVARLTELLAPAVGNEKARELVLDTARQFGYTGEELSFEQAANLLELIGKSPGVVGVAARFASKRIGNRPELDFRQKPAAPPPTASANVTLSELVEVLSKSLGKEKAEDVVAAAAKQLGIIDDAVPKEKALSILERLASQPGITGVAARFAKTRFILRFAS